MERKNEITKTAPLQCQKVAQPCKRELFKVGLGFWEVTTRTRYHNHVSKQRRGLLGALGPARGRTRAAMAGMGPPVFYPRN
jgi:hypothetical protein